MKAQISIFIALTCLSSPPLIAQQDASAVSYQEPITEIVVTSAKGRLLSLRKQVIEAQDRAFNLFNELNDNEEFDIHCFMVAPLGTKIRKRQCAPNYYHTATRNEGIMFLNGVRDTFSSSAPTASQVLSVKNPILQEIMETLTEENPELKDAIEEHYEIETELTELMRSHYDDE